MLGKNPHLAISGVALFVFNPKHGVVGKAGFSGHFTQAPLVCTKTLPYLIKGIDFHSAFILSINTYVRQGANTNKNKA